MVYGAPRANGAPITTRPTRRLNSTKKGIHWRRRAHADALRQKPNGIAATAGRAALIVNLFEKGKP